MTKEISVQLGNYKGIEAKKREVKVEGKEIEDALDYLQKSRAKIITLNSPAQKGNKVEIDFEVRSGGVQVENGLSKNHPLILGEGHFLPGFEDKLEGMKAGEEKEFSLKVPADWGDKRIADKALDFKVKMNIVQERQLPEINDEFAKSLGKFDNIGALKENIKQGLSQEKEIMEKQRIRIELIEKVVDNSKVEAPEELIEKELENMVNEFKMSIDQFGMDFQTYLTQLKTTVEELKKGWKEQAEKRVKIGLCLKAIADKEKIVPTTREVEDKMNQELMRYPDMEKAKKDIDLVAFKEYTENILINEKVFELLEQEAKII
jgi:trigger factor